MFYGHAWETVAELLGEHHAEIGIRIRVFPALIQHSNYCTSWVGRSPTYCLCLEQLYDRHKFNQLSFRPTHTHSWSLQQWGNRFSCSVSCVTPLENTQESCQWAKNGNPSQTSLIWSYGWVFLILFFNFLLRCYFNYECSFQSLRLHSHQTLCQSTATVQEESSHREENSPACCEARRSEKKVSDCFHQ